MTNDERDKLDRTQVRLGQMHRDLCAANKENRGLRIWLYSTLALLIIVVGAMGVFWPLALDTCQKNLALAEDSAAARHASYAEQEREWMDGLKQEQQRRVVAERDLAEVLVQRIPWNTKGNGPLDPPPVTVEQAMERAKKRPASTTDKTNTAVVEAMPVVVPNKQLEEIAALAQRMRKLEDDAKNNAEKTGIPLSVPYIKEQILKMGAGARAWVRP